MKKNYDNCYSNLIQKQNMHNNYQVLPPYTEEKDQGLH